MPDYLRLARELRAKANYVPPPGSSLTAVGPEEKAALLAKARELEDKHKLSSPFTDDTTVTSRDGFTFYGTSPYPYPYGSPEWEAWAEGIRKERQAQAQKIAEDLAKNQWKWNSEYYDRFGNPKPQRGDDYDDIMEETYKYDPQGEDEDYGYDEAFGEQRDHSE